MHDVVIVGAGGAGIGAAMECQRRGLSYIVLEASKSPGGRAKSVQAPDGSVLDLGAHWLHSPMQNPLAAIARESGVRFADVPLRELTSWHGRILRHEESEQCNAAIENAFDAISTDSDVAVSRYSAVAGVWQPAFDAAFTIKQGVHPCAASSRDFADYVWEGDDLPVLDGLGNLVARLAESLNVRLSAAVDAIDLTSSGSITVSGSFGSVKAARVIVTASTAVLARGSIRFSPELPATTLQAIHDLPMGACNKISVPFENADALDGLRNLHLTPYGLAEEATEIVAFEAGSNIVTGLVHGSFGRDLARDGEAAMRNYLLDKLASIFGAGSIRSAGPSCIVANWDDDPFVGGYVSVARPGRAMARAALREPVQSRLFFAGEATSKRFMGDLHGAWLEGTAAVSRF